MITLVKHSPEDKKKIIEVLNALAIVNEQGSIYYWAFEEYFRKGDRHPSKYDEVSEDITSLFIEGLTYRQLYDNWGKSTNSQLPFFNKHPEYGGFLVDCISDFWHGRKGMSGEDRYDHLKVLFKLAKYIDENPLNGKEISNEIIAYSIMHKTMDEKKDSIREKLASANLTPDFIKSVLEMI